MVQNDLHRLAYDNHATTSAALSKEEFVNRYNAPPWEFVNHALTTAGLNFRINLPYLYGFGAYKPVLTKQSSGEELDFTNLSSGEKVLMSFALCVYYAQDRRQIAQYPRLLLLDEVDAPLHPSMCRQLLRTITETLVSTYDIHVILATHSATTVALAPQESVHVMRGGSAGLSKTTKGSALNLLTDGVPTVALDFKGRRQVLVESVHDALIYERLYREVRSHLDSERSLEFIGVGRTPAEGSGCSQVRHIVQSLVGAGNKTVFGLVDWDNGAEAGQRVEVFAPAPQFGELYL